MKLNENKNIVEQPKNQNDVASRFDCVVSRKPKTYRQILKHFGFERITGKDSVRGLPNFTHPKNNWYAEIIDYGYFTACWIVGGNIRNTNSYPGGKHCDTPEILFAALEKAQQGLSG